MSNKLAVKMKSLSLQPGDILVLERGFVQNSEWPQALRDAGKEAGVNFNVPIVFVDDIEKIAVVRMG